jgi:periplasmic protein TonB
VQLHIERDSEDPGSDGAAAAGALAALGAVKPIRPGTASAAERPAEGSSTANELVLPPITPAQRRRRVAFKVAAVLSLALHAGSLCAFLAWHGSTDTGALARPSDAVSVEIVDSRTLEARQPQQASEPAASPEATAPVEGKAEASNAQPVQPEPKEAPKIEIVVPQPPFAIPDTTEVVTRTVKQETPVKSEALPVPELGPTAIVPPPPKSGVDEDNAPAKQEPPKQPEKKKTANPAPQGGVTSKSSDGKGKGGERVSASSGAMLNYAAEVRARVAGNKPSGGGLRGTAVVTFGLTPSGGLAYAGLGRSSGDPQLDQLAVAAVRSAAPFPTPPSGATSAQLRFAIPFHFQ